MENAKYVSGSNKKKAYKNIEFLNSPDARPIRLLSEFLEPQRRLRREGIKDTIVFFGSARTKSLRKAKQEIRHAEQIYKRTQKKRDRLKLDESREGLAMAKYYEDAVTLAAMLTNWSHKLQQPNRFVICSGGGPELWKRQIGERIRQREDRSDSISACLLNRYQIHIYHVSWIWNFIIFSCANSGSHTSQKPSSCFQAVLEHWTK